MSSDDRATYPPLNTLKRVADDVWIVDGPALRFGPRFLRMPFPTRMSVVRLAGGALFVHSPTPLTRALATAIDEIGRPRWIVGPNRIHYWWIPEWRAAYRDAEVYLAPRIREQARGRVDFPAHMLDAAGGYPWDAEMATLPVEGGYMTEFVFFHIRSRTLILADLIENFEREKLPARWMRWLTRLGGVQHPGGGMPADLRVTFLRHRAELRRAVETMLSWHPERIVLAHGRWYRCNAQAELRRAFRGVLED